MQITCERSINTKWIGLCQLLGWHHKGWAFWQLLAYQKPDERQPFESCVYYLNVKCCLKFLRYFTERRSKGKGTCCFVAMVSWIVVRPSLLCLRHYQALEQIRMHLSYPFNRRAYPLHFTSGTWTRNFGIVRTLDTGSWTAGAELWFTILPQNRRKRNILVTENYVHKSS